MKKFLILGADSRLAKCFQQIYSIESIGLTKKQCDITNLQSLSYALRQYKCPYILNFAAKTDIEACELNPKDCFTVNTVGVYFLNMICKKNRRKLIHISSDYAVKPVNIYGWSKLASEQLMFPDTLIFRSNFYDASTYIVKEILHNHRVPVYTNVMCNPISIFRLVKEINNNIEKKGTINLFTNKKITWYEFGRIFCDIFQRDKNLLKQIVYKDTEGFALRPLSSYIKSDITVNIKEDIQDFKKYLTK